MVDKVRSRSPHPKLHIALVEEMLRYSGENGIRFHPMVVHSLAGPNASGLTVNPARPTFVQHVFGLDNLSAELKAHLDDYEVNGQPSQKVTFREKKHTLDAKNLSVVAFVQDEKSKQILQAGYVKVEPAVTSANQ